MLSKKSVFISIPFLNKRNKAKEEQDHELSSLLETIAKNKEDFIKVINEKHSKTK